MKVETMKIIKVSVIVIFVYSFMSILLGLKSLYSVVDIIDQFKLINFVYSFILYAGFIYLVYHFYNDKKQKLALTLLMSILIGYLPYESEYLRCIELIHNPNQNLSPLASKLNLPTLFSIIFDLLFYPVLLFLNFLLLFFITKKKEPTATHMYESF